jgi:hypothetical protein
MSPTPDDTQGEVCQLVSLNIHIGGTVYAVLAVSASYRISTDSLHHPESVLTTDHSHHIFFAPSVEPLLAGPA